jgi:hypothetical protein
MFNITFNNISAISWRSVLLVEETGGPGEKHRPVATHWQLLSHKKSWLARTQYNVSEWDVMSIHGLLLQLARVLVWYKAKNLIIISLKINLFSPRYS